MTAVVTRTESTALQVTPDRDELISRYRHLRKINKQHHSEVMRFLSRDWILQNGRRIGLVDNETFILESEDDLGFVFDLSIYTAPRDAREPLTAMREPRSWRRKPMSRLF